MLREFDAQLQKGDNPGAWTCVVLDDAAELFGTALGHERAGERFTVDLSADLHEAAGHPPASRVRRRSTESRWRWTRAMIVLGTGTHKPSHTIAEVSPSQINASIHRIAVTGLRCHPETQDHIARKRAEGK